MYDLTNKNLSPTKNQKRNLILGAAGWVGQVLTGKAQGPEFRVPGAGIKGGDVHL